MTIWTPRSLLPSERAEIASQSIGMGYSIRRTADYLQVSPSTVRRDLRAYAEQCQARRDIGPDAHRWTP